MSEKQVFIFKETVPSQVHPTIIDGRYLIAIPGEETKFYRVLPTGLPETYGPQPFMLIENGKTVRGWRFEALEITNPQTIKLLREKKIPCLVLNPQCVERVE